MLLAVSSMTYATQQRMPEEIQIQKTALNTKPPKMLEKSQTMTRVVE